MEPWQSWLLAVGIGGAAAVYYSQGKGGTKVATAHRTSTSVDQTDSTSTSKKKQPKQKSVAPGKSILIDSNAPKNRQERVDKGGSSHQRGPSVTFGTDDDSQAQEDKEWARQLEANRKGVAISTDAKASAKSKKQNKKNEEPPRAESSSSVFANDVSDMLEPAAPAPTSIRITGEEKVKKPKAPSVTPVQQETKKQRQNRRKAEEKKTQREHDEKERQVLLEQQRRTARESRGEPARNGVGSAQVSNAWPTQSVTNGAAHSDGQTVAPLLDTFEPRSVSTTGVDAAQLATPARTAVSSTLGQDLPSEETQMQILNEMNGWAEVPSKAKKSKNIKKAADGGHALAGEPTLPTKKENPFAGVSTNELIGGTKNGKKSANTNNYAALEAATSFASSAKGHPQDSDWAAN